MPSVPMNLNIRRILILAMITIAFTAISCRLPNLRQPEYVHHPQPDFNVNFDIFIKAGCVQGDYGQLDCTEVEALSSMECDLIYQTGNLLGGLDPNLPLAQCEYVPYRHDQYDLELYKGTYFYNSGCSMPFLVRYIVPQAGGFTRVSDTDGLANIFAPIRSPEEALSYAIATTGLSALYDIKLPRNFRFLADKIEDTHVEQTSAGYEVFLYDDYLCGCGPHTVSVVKVLVTPDGQIQKYDPQPVYQDPKNDDLCID